MAYTNIWNDSLPTGAEAANTIDDIFRSLKVDIEQRFIDIFAMPNFTADPLRPYGIKFTDAQDGVLSLGDNAGTPRFLTVKNKANSITYITMGQGLRVNSGGLIVDISGITIGAGGLTITAGTAALQAVTCTTLITSGNVSVVGSVSTTSTIQVNNTTTSTLVLNTTSGALTDTQEIYFERGGNIKWRIGNNITGTNVDLFEIYNEFIPGSALTFNLANNLIAAQAGFSVVGVSTFSGVTCTTSTASGLITGNAGLTISSGTSALQAVTTTTINTTSTITGGASVVATLSLVAGNASSIGFNGRSLITSTADGVLNFFFNNGVTRSAINFGAANGNNGLTISSGTSALQALTCTTLVPSGNSTLQVVTCTSLTVSVGITTVNFIVETTALATFFINTTSGAATDQAYISFMRGNVQKYLLGLNVNGSSSDAFGIQNVNRATIPLVISFTTDVITFLKGPTVGSGTTALQAVTCTTLVTSSDLTVTTTMRLLNASAPGTPTSSGCVYVAAGALRYKGSSGTDTLLAPA